MLLDDGPVDLLIRRERHTEATNSDWAWNGEVSLQTEQGSGTKISKQVGI